MIVRPDGDHLILIPQTDHALLSGAMAAQWGNNAFARPEPRAEVLLAVDGHDNGWEEWDARPRVDPATGRPYAFTNMPVDAYLEIWRRGIARMRGRDTYAGLLVGRHGVRLVGRRLARGQDPPEVLGKIARFVAEAEAQEWAAKAELGGAAGWSAADETRLEANYALLRTCDALSLLLCCGPLAATTMEEAPGAGIEQRLSLHLTSCDAAMLCCDPYPFGTAEIPLTITGCRIPDRVYRSDEELWAAIAIGAAKTFEFRLTAPPPMAGSRSD
jgi:hypothetical protein